MNHGANPVFSKQPTAPMAPMPRGQARRNERHRAHRRSFAAFFKEELLALLLILLAGAGLRAAYFQETAQVSDRSLSGAEEQFQNHWAYALASGDWTPMPGTSDPGIQSAPFYRPPAYPHVLAAVYGLSAGDLRAVRFMQMAFGLLNAVLMFLLARALFGRNAALFAAAFMAGYWVFIHAEAGLNGTVFIVFLLLLLLHLLRRWPERAGAPSLLVAGVVLGALGCFQPGLLALAPLVLIWCLFTGVRRKSRPRVALGGLALLLGVLLALAPGAWRNYRVSGEFVPIAAGAGLELYAGNNAQADAIFSKIDVKEAFGLERPYSLNDTPQYLEALKKKTGREDMTYSGMCRYFTARALGYMAEDPVRTFRGLAKKAALSWGPIEMADNTLTQYDKAGSIALRWLPGFPAVLALFLAGVAWLFARIRAERRSDAGVSAGSRILILSLLTAAVIFLSYWPFAVATHSRAILTPFLMLFGAQAAAWLIAAIQTRRIRAALAGIATCAILFGLTNIQMIPVPRGLAQWHYDRALAFDRSGKADLALEEYRHCVAAAALPQVHRDYGNALAHAGRYDEAVAQYAEERRLYPETPFVEQNWGQVLLLQGKPEQAAERFAGALSANPDSLELAGLLGDALVDAGREAEAQQQFESILRRDPKFQWSSRVQMSPAELKDEEAQIAATMRRCAAYAETHTAFGKAIAQQKGLEEAIYHFREAIRLYSSSASAHSSLGVALMEQNNLEGAREELSTALSLNPKDAQAECARANLLWREGKMAESITSLREALERNPGNTELLNGLGFQLAEAKQVQEAEVVFGKALEQDPGNQLAHNNLGNLLTDLGRYVEAIPHFEAILKQYPEDPFAEFNWGRALALNGQGTAAIEHFRRALAKHPNLIPAHNFLGFELSKLGQNEEAIKEFEAALRLNPDFILARNNLGTVLMEQGKLDEASLHFREALRVNPNDPYPAEHLKTIEERKAATQK